MVTESLHFSFIPLFVVPNSHYWLNIRRNDHVHDLRLSVTLQELPGWQSPLSVLCPPLESSPGSLLHSHSLVIGRCWWIHLPKHFGFCPFSVWCDLTRRLRRRVLLEHKLNCKHFGPKAKLMMRGHTLPVGKADGTL